MSWPTNTIEVEGYDNWQAQVYELTVNEVDELRRLLNLDATTRDTITALSEAIKEWNFTDRDGNLLEVTEENLGLIPASALSSLLRGIMMRISARPFEDQMNTTNSLPTIQQSDEAPLT